MRASTASSLNFLVIDENPDGRFLLSKSLLRTFPHAAVVECQSADTAFRELRSRKIAAILAHRTFEYEGVNLVREIRKVNPSVPLIMTSGIDRREQALAAGATCFFNYDQWLTIGPFMADLLRAAPATRKPSAASAKSRVPQPQKIAV
jgi:DNA-binding NtrC family response regulator